MLDNKCLVQFSAKQFFANFAMPNLCIFPSALRSLLCVCTIFPTILRRKWRKVIRCLCERKWGALFHNVSGKSCYYHVSFNSTVLGLTGFPKHVKWTIFSNNLIMYIFRNKSIIWCFFGFWHYKNSCLRFSKLRGKRLKKYNEKSRMRLDMSYRVQKLSGM